MLAYRDLDPARLATGHGPVVEAPCPAITRAIAAARKIERPARALAR
jgi:hypothetical protein